MRKKQIERCKFCHRKLTNRERRTTRLRYYEEPSGYVALSDWADEMLKTHVQQKCPGCGRYSMWEPK